MKAPRIEWRNIRFVPVLHNRMEFAVEVRRQFEEFGPDLVAVEYPDTMREPILKAIKRLPLLSAAYYREGDGTFIYLLLEPTDGQVEALRLALQNDLSVHFVDRDTEGYPLHRFPMPDSYSIRKIGHYLYCQAYLTVRKNDKSSLEDELRERTMAYHLQQLCHTGKRILFVGGLFHLPGILRMLAHPQTEVIGRRHREGVGLAHLHQESSREVMAEMPLLSSCYERFRAGEITTEMDRLEIHRDLIERAGNSHWKNSKERLSISQIRVLYKFARNYAYMSGALVPSFYQLIVAARGAADDNFAYEVWKEGSAYPWQEENPGLSVLQLKGEDLFLDQQRIHFHRRLKTFRRRLVPIPIKKRAQETVPGEWKRKFDHLTICSYPPEDIVIEGYGRELQHKALRMKSEEHSRIAPFVSSMMEGLDVRETIRQWHEGKIYVREGRPFSGKVGSVVVIFDPDVPGDQGAEHFPWKVTWLGEHEQESDMAFYSTPAGEIMDGPGISRCQYGGFMMTYPPLRVFDIWKDPFFRSARNKPERLLMAAIDYSMEKHIIYVAAKPPSGWCQSMSSRLGKKIIYMPIGSFSPIALKKIRQFHVLAGHYVRRYARQYI